MKVFLPLRRALLAIAGLFSVLPAVAAAADVVPAIPDPATITAPDIATNDPKVLANGHKFFVFHSATVDFRTAYADIAECRSFLPPGPGRALPGFIPWVAAPPPAPVRPTGSPYGLVGDVMAAIILPKLARGQANTILRRCMESRGYVRHAVAEPVWEALNDPANASSTAILAKLASGPKPPQPEVTDQ